MCANWPPLVVIGTAAGPRSSMDAARAVAQSLPSAVFIGWQGAATGAFPRTQCVNSLVDNLLMPVIAMIIGKPDFRGLTFTINEAVFSYGSFITDVIQFVAIAAAVFFFVVKPMSALLTRMRGPVEGLPDEERRHQELLTALREISSR